MMIQTLNRAARGLGRPRRIARAHTGTHSYATVEINGTEVTGTVQFPVGDLNHVLGLAVPLGETGAAAAIEKNRDEINAYIDGHFAISSGGEHWPVRLGGFRVLERKKFTYAIFEYSLDPALSEVPLEFSIEYDGIVEAKSGHEGMAIVRQQVGFGKLRSKLEQRWAVLPGQTSFAARIKPDSMTTHLFGASQQVIDTGRELIRRARKRLRRSA